MPRRRVVRGGQAADACSRGRSLEDGGLCRDPRRVGGRRLRSSEGTDLAAASRECGRGRMKEQRQERVKACQEGIKPVGNRWAFGAHLIYSPGAMRSSWLAVNERSAGRPATGVNQEERRWPTR